MAQPRPITFAGMQWPSARACSEALGLDKSQLNRWLRAGHADIPESHGKKAPYRKGPYSFGGRDDWPSVRAMAEHYGRSRTAVLEWLEKGYTEPPESKGGRSPVPVHFAGRDWPSAGACSRALEIPPTSLRRWIKKGYTGIPENRPKHGPFTFNGVTHRTLADLALHEGIGWRTARRWVCELGLTETPEWHRPVKRPDDGRLKGNRKESE